jgi:4-deoxy-L-threo-5-hexosulose-uronate ketol-isomerase
VQIRFQNSPTETSRMTTQELRSHFLVDELIINDKVQLVYSHYDRVITGGAKPVGGKLVLENDPELRAGYFLERREIGIINVGGIGTIEADGENFTLNKLDCLYLGKGTKQVLFKSNSQKDPAVYFLLSAPAHTTYPNSKLSKEEASPVSLGEIATANQRTIYKYIHADGIKSCQLVMGLTVLNNGSVWNTMPPHTHTRRMEAYFYFDVQDHHRVFHFMGEPNQTRHLLIANHQAILSPPWSIHAGAGTSNYSFIWGMAGENYNFTDMDAVAITELL